MATLRTYIGKTNTGVSVTLEVERVDATRVRVKQIRNGTSAATQVLSNAEADTLVADLQALRAPLPIPDEPTPPPPPPPPGAIQIVSELGSFGSVTRLQARTYERIRMRGLVILPAGCELVECQVLGYGGTQPINPPDVQCWMAGASRLYRTQVADNQYHAGVYVDADDCAVEDCHLLNNGGRDSNRSHGIYWDKGLRGKLTGTLIEGSMAFGAQIYPGVSQVTVQRNLFRQNGNAGIVLGGAQGCDISANWFDRNVGACITTAGSASGCHAHDNYATGNGSDTYAGSGYTKGSLTKAPPPAGWAVPQPLTFTGP